jgi:hypothetical protein
MDRSRAEEGIMWDTRNIIAARIVKRRRGSAAGPESLGRGERTVFGLLESGEEVVLFSYDEDELIVDPRELAGLSVSVARRLRHERELANLQS